MTDRLPKTMTDPMLTIPTQIQPVPVKRWDDGSIRIGETRVLLDLVVYKYRDGYTPIDIVRSYSTLKLADVHLVLAWYLNNQAEVDAYIAEGERIIAAKGKPAGQDEFAALFLERKSMLKQSQH